MKRFKFICSVLGKGGVIIESILLAMYLLSTYATIDLFIGWLEHREMTGISFAEFAPTLFVGNAFLIFIAFFMRKIWEWYKREYNEQKDYE